VVRRVPNPDSPFDPQQLPGEATPDPYSHSEVSGFAFLRQDGATISVHQSNDTGPELDIEAGTYGNTRWFRIDRRVL